MHNFHRPLACIIICLMLSGCCQNAAKPTPANASHPSQTLAQENLTFYTTQSYMTNPGPMAGLYSGLPGEPEKLVPIVQGLLMHGGLCWLYKHEPQEAQKGGDQLRSASEILAKIAELDSAP